MDHFSISLAEATNDQLLVEIRARFPTHIVAGVIKMERDGEKLFQVAMSKDDYIGVRGLHAVIGEHINNWTKQVFDEWNQKEE